MSATPPNVPPGGGAPPPYDPKTQWRIYREQQHAAWRAQRDAWRAQQHAWKHAYRGMYASRVPSLVGPILLILIGVVALLVITGHIPAREFWTWYGHWWPLLLIAAGLAMLVEWTVDLRRKTPVRRGGGFVGLLILLAFVGICAAGVTGSWKWMGENFGNNGFWGHFGLPEHNLDRQVLNTPIPVNATVTINIPRGDVSIASGDGPNAQIEAHLVAYANSDSDAKKIFDAEAPNAAVSGSNVAISSQDNDHGQVNLTVILPKTAHVTVKAGRGDVSATGLNAGIDITAPRGNTRLSAITGPVQVHLAGGRHNFSAHQINGNITLDGNCNDLTFSAIKGGITTTGEILGEVYIENVSQPINLRTSVTDLQIASLPGQMTLDSNTLRVVAAKGAVRVVTHDKDVDLSQIYGDTYVKDRVGRISVAPAGPYAIEAMNGKGAVNITLPPNAAGTVDGRTHNGNVVTDFALKVSGDADKTVTGQIGAGGPKIVLSSIDGDLRIRKGPAFPAQPPAPGAAAQVLHLKTPKGETVQPVTQ
jgi:energy-coupling factor transporter transmembrane protein EcfT